MSNFIKWSLLISLCLIGLLLFLAVFDISNSDKFLALKIFRVRNWDMDFYQVSSLLISVTVPTIVAIFTVLFSKRKNFEYKIGKITAFSSKLQLSYLSALKLVQQKEIFSEYKELTINEYQMKLKDLRSSIAKLAEAICDSNLFFNSSLNKLIIDYLALIEKLINSVKKLKCESIPTQERTELIRKIEKYMREIALCVDNIRLQCRTLIEEFES